MNQPISQQKFKQHLPSQMERQDFIHAFADVYENSAWMAEKAWGHGLTQEHDNITILHRLFADILNNSDHQTQLDLINAHPDLAGKAAVAGELTRASSAEQRESGILQCTVKEFSRFIALNNAYQAKFGFPFIKAVKGSNRYQILESFEQRINNSPNDEFEQALQEINKIALFRLQTM